MAVRVHHATGEGKAHPASWHTELWRALLAFTTIAVALFAILAAAALRLRRGCHTFLVCLTRHSVLLASLMLSSIFANSIKCWFFLACRDATQA